MAKYQPTHVALITFGNQGIGKTNPGPELPHALADTAVTAMRDH